MAALASCAEKNETTEGEAQGMFEKTEKILHEAARRLAAVLMKMPENSEKATKVKKAVRIERGRERKKETERKG